MNFQGYDKGESGEIKLITFAQVKDSGKLVPIKIEDYKGEGI